MSIDKFYHFIMKTNLAEDMCKSQGGRILKAYSGLRHFCRKENFGAGTGPVLCTWQTKVGSGTSFVWDRIWRDRLSVIHKSVQRSESNFYITL